MAKKPATSNDTLTAIAGLGVELALLSDKLDKLAARVATSERRLDDAKAVPLHLIEVKQAVSDLREAAGRIEERQSRPWWRVF